MPPFLVIGLAIAGYSSITDWFPSNRSSEWYLSLRPVGATTDTILSMEIRWKGAAKSSGGTAIVVNGFSPSQTKWLRRIELPSSEPSANEGEQVATLLRESYSGESLPFDELTAEFHRVLDLARKRVAPGSVKSAVYEVTLAHCYVDDAPTAAFMMKYVIAWGIVLIVTSFTCHQIRMRNKQANVAVCLIPLRNGDRPPNENDRRPGHGQVS